MEIKNIRNIQLIYDIGTEILIFHCFATKMLKSFCKSIIFSGIATARRQLSFQPIKTRFKVLWDFFSKICMRPWIRSLSNILPKRPLRDDFLAQNTILSAQKAPAGRFSGSKYNFIRPKGPCGTLVWLKIQFCLPKRPTF